MSDTFTLDEPLHWPQIAQIANRGTRLELSMRAQQRIEASQALVQSIVAQGLRAYGINTGVGALSDVAIAPAQQSELSHNILMSHAVGLGAPLGIAETRAIMAASINNHALGFSGLRLAVVQRLIELLNRGCTPEVPRQGSVGYLSHRAHIGLAVIGQGFVYLKEQRLAAREALRRLGLEPITLLAKEGLCLVNGSGCAAGLACLGLERVHRLLQWADVVAAMSFETQRGQLSALAPPVMALRISKGLQAVAATLQEWLHDSALLAAAAGRRTQDALSLRAIPQVHGAIRDAWDSAAEIVERELASFTDNPAVAGSSAAPLVQSQAHPVAAALALAMDQLAIAIAELGGISERRIDRMVNPLVSGLPAFLAGAGGTRSGFMIAQYAAVSLVSENRRLAAPASLDGGITSGLQEDMLCHATPAALKVLDIVANVQNIIAIELLAACQSYDLLPSAPAPAPRTRALHRAVRAVIPSYADDRPLGQDIARAASLIGEQTPDMLSRQEPS